MSNRCQVLEDFLFQLLPFIIQTSFITCILSNAMQCDSGKKELKKVRKEMTWHQGGDCEQASRKEEVSGGLCKTCCHRSDRRHSGSVRAVPVGSCFAAGGYSSCSGFDTFPFCHTDKPQLAFGEDAQVKPQPKGRERSDATKGNHQRLD